MVKDKEVGWEDTLLIKENILEIFSPVPSELYASVIKRGLEVQAKATWEAREPEIEKARQEGRQEVVDWIEKHCIFNRKELEEFKKAKELK